MKPVLIIILIIVCSIIAWTVGLQLRRYVGLWEKLQEAKDTLRPGYQLGKGWYKYRRKALLGLISFSALSIFFPLVASVWSYRVGNDLGDVLLKAFLATSPAILGYFGVIPIPIPGLDIED